jgi:acid phosphatase (class A)
MKKHLAAVAMGATVLFLAACADTPSLYVPLPPTRIEAVGELRPGIAMGYLPIRQGVDSLALLPAPPASGSAAQLADDAAYQQASKGKGTPRWNLAAADAELKFPKAAHSFSCALGVPIEEEEAPHLTMLLRRTLTDAGLATYKAKDAYKRIRPFVVFNGESCTPKEETSLRKDGSYPSGHASVGWAWGLVLTEIAPQRANELVQRGYEFGQSRVACGVHWPSDVEAGRLVGAAVVAQLKSNPSFQRQSSLAREEYVKLRGQHPQGLQGCEAERTALRLAPHAAP